VIFRFRISKEARIFHSQRWKKAPLVAGFRAAKALSCGGCAARPAWLRPFPIFAQALADLGLEPPFVPRICGRFFHSAYRSRVDLDYFAPRCGKPVSLPCTSRPGTIGTRPAGRRIPAPLIEACHRNAIQVTPGSNCPTWSERFWSQHPEWREKTALLQDAQLDWRKLMNLTNRAAFRNCPGTPQFSE